MRTNTKIFWLLWTLSIISAILILPYVFNAGSELLSKAAIPLPVLILISIIQGTVTFGIAAFLGLILAEKTGFKLPLLSSWIDHKIIGYRRILWSSIALGLAAGILISGIDAFAFNNSVKINVPIWQGFLACFYGGMTEEILMRLFLVSLFAFILLEISRRKEPAPIIIWFSIVFVSVLFGLGHLPITSAIVDITPMVVFRAIVLNGIGGVIFGWLYWRNGLESAIISHFSADIILQVIVPMLR